jgi:hypothetical protein
VRVGVVCEGSTDAVVLRAIVRALCAPQDPLFSVLQPPVSASGHVGLGGWQAVRSFLRGPPAYLAAARLDMIVVHVDADIRGDPEVAPYLVPEEGDEDLDPLCRHVKLWMTGGVLDSMVIVLPRESTETWLLSATTNRKNVEAIPHPVEALVEVHALAAAKGKGAKVAAAYEEMVKPLLPKLGKPKELAAIPELERFVGKVRARIRRVAAEAKRARGARL